ncbi:RAS-related protein rgp1 [Phtheirospermum japonicum]|uniref:RAS-related protein rgp1 n=1 Tax=Phtheirospermum japonicum TaxID=374723 RepID=A0A830CJ61_9LAMI|nr:RAS-related protein rgp1 [Phtheirospermum japonicum]
MLVYDMTKRQSFDHVARWVEELRAHTDNSIVIMLVSNKADLMDLRTVTKCCRVRGESGPLFLQNIGS